MAPLKLNASYVKCMVTNHFHGRQSQIVFVIREMAHGYIEDDNREGRLSTSTVNDNLDHTNELILANNFFVGFLLLLLLYINFIFCNARMAMAIWPTFFFFFLKSRMTSSCHPAVNA